jgi:hypothetical protein
MSFGDMATSCARAPGISQQSCSDTTWALALLACTAHGEATEPDIQEECTARAQADGERVAIKETKMFELPEEKRERCLKVTASHKV